MNYFSGSIPFDLILLILSIGIFKTFILKQNLSDKERFFLIHTPTYIYIPLSILIIISMVYIVAVDRKLINDDYILFAQIIMSAVFFITMIITVHHRIKYGNKDWKYKEDTKIMIIGLSMLIFIFVMIWLFG